MKTLQTDVLVVGGGTAGVTAALAAADQGCAVLLMECGTGVGGVGTHAGIHAYYMGTRAGLQVRLDERMKQISERFASRAKGFHPDAKKLAIAEFLAERNVVVVYEAVAVHAAKTGNAVTSVWFETPEQSICVNATITVDCTANGDVCALAGAPYAGGREWDGVMHGYSMPPRFLNSGEGRVEFKNFDAGWVDSSSAKDVSRAMLEGRKLLRDLRELEDQEWISTASQIGAREGRHICGAYVLQMEDLLLDRRFDDVVMKCYSHYDNHARDVANESRFGQLWVGMMNLWSQKFGGDVPYRCFVPQGVDGLLIGCRALSMNRDVHTGLRMQRDMHLVGEVAGIAAGLCCAAGRQPAELDVSTLQRRLIDRGVISEHDLSRRSLPWVVLGGDRREDGVWTPEYVRRPEARQRLIAALGSEEEGFALWWLWQAGPSAIVDLEQALRQSKGTQRRGIAMALALLGSRSGVPDLMQSVFSQDADALPGHADRTPPRWIASLLALKELREPGCAEWLLDHVVSEEDDPVRLPEYARILYMFHYMIDVAERLPDALRRKAVEVVRQILHRDDLGSQWGRIHRSQVTIRWSLELTGAYLLGLLGDRESEQVLARYAQDSRVFAKAASELLSSRLNRANDSNMKGMNRV